LCRLYCAVMTEVYVLIYLSSGYQFTAQHVSDVNTSIFRSLQLLGANEHKNILLFQCSIRHFTLRTICLLLLLAIQIYHISTAVSHSVSLYS